MRVVVAEDSVLLREGIGRLLDEAGFEVVGQAGDADDGLRAALEIRRNLPGTGVLVLSQCCSSTPCHVWPQAARCSTPRSLRPSWAAGGATIRSRLTDREREVLALMARVARTRRSPSR